MLPDPLHRDMRLRASITAAASEAPPCVACIWLAWSMRSLMTRRIWSSDWTTPAASKSLRILLNTSLRSGSMVPTARRPRRPRRLGLRVPVFRRPTCRGACCVEPSSSHPRCRSLESHCSPLSRTTEAAFGASTCTQIHLRPDDRADTPKGFYAAANARITPRAPRLLPRFPCDEPGRRSS